VSLVRRGTVLGIVRRRAPGNVLATFEALFEGGLELVEVTIDTPGALDAVAEWAGRDRTVGVGTVTSARQVRAAAAAGASFVVSPGLVDEVVTVALEHGIEPIPGVFTPTEVTLAVSLGASVLKLFPASLGGPSYLRELSGPFPEVGFIPTGGARSARHCERTDLVEVHA
jgi:2-dehydro-3-deoxyphosphogluconate aldolase / (4S)-4-hydroxy-2-oxoglutarate aldolase